MDMSSNQNKSTSIDISEEILYFSKKLDFNISNYCSPTYSQFNSGSISLNKDENIDFSISVILRNLPKPTKPENKIHVKLEFNKNINFIALKILLRLKNYNHDLEFNPKRFDSNPKLFAAERIIPNSFFAFYMNTINAYNPTYGQYDTMQAFCFNEIFLLYSFKINRFNKLSESLEKALKFKEFTDLIIIVNEKEFHVHKLIICSKSEVFKKMIQTDMLEKQSSIINLKDTIKVGSFEEILNFIYQEFCDVSKDVHNIFSFAHQYEIEDLQNHCKKYMLSNVNNLNKVETFKLINVEDYHLDDLKVVFEKYINENEKDVVKDEIYVNHLVDNMTCKNVHHIFRLGMVYKLEKIDKVKEFIVLNLEEIMKNNEDFVELVKSVPDYMFEILSAITVNKFNISLKDE